MKRYLLLMMLFFAACASYSKDNADKIHEETNKNDEFIENSEYYAIVLRIKRISKDIIEDRDVDAIEYEYLNKYLNMMAKRGYELHSITPIIKCGTRIGINYTSELILTFKKKQF